MVDNRSDNLNLPLPDQTNQLQEDVLRLKTSLNYLDDGCVRGVASELGRGRGASIRGCVYSSTEHEGAVLVPSCSS